MAGQGGSPVMATRTHDQILDEAVYAAACVAYHYGSGFSEEGLQALRKLLGQMRWDLDSTYRVDAREGDPHIDFHTRIIWPPDWWQLDFQETVKESYAEPNQD